MPATMPTFAWRQRAWDLAHVKAMVSPCGRASIVMRTAEHLFAPGLVALNLCDLSSPLPSSLYCLHPLVALDLCDLSNPTAAKGFFGPNLAPLDFSDLSSPEDSDNGSRG